MAKAVRQVKAEPDKNPTVEEVTARACVCECDSSATIVRQCGCTCRSMVSYLLEKVLKYGPLGFIG